MALRPNMISCCKAPLLVKLSVTCCPTLASMTSGVKLNSAMEMSMTNASGVEGPQALNATNPTPMIKARYNFCMFLSFYVVRGELYDSIEPGPVSYRQFCVYV